MNQNIKHIARHYGFQHQAIKTVEEMADVLVMLEQMQYFLNIDLALLHTTMEAKVHRQIERMNQH